MKKIYNMMTLNLILSILMLIIGSNIVMAAQPNIILSGFGINGGGASVGKDFVLALNLSNIGSACATDVTATIQAGQPFIMQGVSTISAEDLCYGLGETVNIPLKIDPTATGGFYQLTVANNYQDLLNNPYTSYSTINIFVNGTPDMNVHVSGTNPVDVYPGDTAALTMTIQNDGTFDAQSVNATLISDSSLIVKWSNSFALLGTISAKDSRTAQFTIEIPKNSTGISFPMHLTISYLDQNLEQQTKTFYITFYAKSKALFTTSDAGSDKLSPNDNSRVVRLNIKNTGTDVAKNIKVRIEPQFPFSTDGSVRYIDTLSPGATAPVNLIVDIDKDATIGLYGLSMIVNYEDAEGNQLQDTTDFPLTIARKGFFVGVFLDYWFLWLVAIVVAVIVIKRRGKAEKKK
jgi:hypothetical protein